MKSRNLNTDFFKKWTPEMAYVLGYFAADGSMLRNKRGGCFIEFTTTDRHMLRNLKRVTHAGQRIAERKIRNAKWKKQYRLQIGSKEWFNDLSKLGFTQAKSNTLRFPTMPSRYHGHFIRGYFDGDGCVYFKKLKFTDRRFKRSILMTLFTCGSKSFLASLWEILRQYGVIGGTIQQKRRGYELKFSHKDSVALYVLMYHTVLATDLYLPRKRKLLEKAIRILYPNAVVV